jgi:hypothetical protein
VFDTTPLQAPKGGCKSPENNEWYQGGQFLPSTCLPKGTHRKVIKSAAVAGNVARLEVTQGQLGYVVYATYAGQVKRRALHNCSTADEAEAFAREFLKAKRNWYIQQGYTPHPTVLVLPPTAHAP